MMLTEQGNNEPTRMIAFVGLGAMGLPMATRLLDCGHKVVVVPHRSREAVERLAQRGATVAETPEAAAAAAAIVITMLPNDEIVESVLFGPSGVVRGARPGTVIVDMSTISPTSAVRIGERLGESGLAFLDAPVSGGPTRAGTGELAIMVGGPEATLAAARPILEALGTSIFPVGPTGSGQIIKACNNLVGAACMLADAEALALAQAHGIEPAVAREVILAGTGANWQLDKTIPLTVLENDYSPRFALSLLNKDLGIAGTMAADESLPSFVGDLVRSVYQDAQTRYGGDRDFSSVYRLYGSG